MGTAIYFIYQTGGKYEHGHMSYYKINFVSIGGGPTLAGILNPPLDTIFRPPLPLPLPLPAPWPFDSDGAPSEQWVGVKKRGFGLEVSDLRV